MDSRMLWSEGFKKLESPQEDLERVPQKAAVYVLCLRRQLERVHGKTDIIYIGETGDLQNRLAEYGGNWKKEGGTGHRIYESLRRLDEPVDLLFKLAERLSLSRRAYERQLLWKFSKEHIELPAWNRQA